MLRTAFVLKRIGVRWTPQNAVNHIYQFTRPQYSDFTKENRIRNSMGSKIERCFNFRYEEVYLA